MPKVTTDKITELDKKIQFLMEKTGCHDNLSRFAEKTQINRRTLSDNKDTTGRMSGGNQLKLAQACQFRVDWDEWLNGTAEEFKAKYEREVGTCSVQERERKLGANLEVDKSIRPKSHFQHLASLEAGIGQHNPGEPIPINLELICSAERIGGDKLTIKRGFYRLKLGEARAQDKKKWLGLIDPYKVREDKKLFIKVDSGDSAEPVWEVYSEDGPLGVVLPDDAFCDVTDLAPGDVIKATFETYLKDHCLELEESEDLSPVKEAFLQRVSQKVLFDTDEDMIELSSHDLHFVEKKREGCDE